MNGKKAGYICAVLFAVCLFSPHPVEANSDLIESAVRTYFKENPVMIEIARCESKFKQFNADGSPLYGGWGGGMVGVFQFYERIHKNGAAALGFDLRTVEGNLAYAKHVFSLSGTTPWNSSKSCWGNVALSQTLTITPDADIATLRARIVTLTKMVSELQKMLEQKKIASDVR